MNLAKLRTFIASSDYRRGQYRRRLWPLLRPVLDTVPAIGIEHDGMLFFVHSEDVVITYSLLAKGEWQRAEVSKVLAILAGVMKKDGVFVNVGANVGTTLTYVMKSGLFASALAFEPEPRNARLLKANIAVNSLPNCAVVEAAISNVPGTLAFELNPTNRGEHRVVQHGLSDGRREQIVVPADTLDTFLSERHVRPEDVALLWIDTEGYESAVLEGATGLLKAGVPLVTEFAPGDLMANGTLDSLLAAIGEGFPVYIDLAASTPDRACVSRLPALALSLQATNERTDLLLLPSAS